MHENISEDDSGLPRRVRTKIGTFKYWKVGWMEEIEDELRNRLMVIKDKEEK